MVLESKQTQEKTAVLVLVNAISLSWTLAYIRVHNNAILSSDSATYRVCYKTITSMFNYMYYIISVDMVLDIPY